MTFLSPYFANSSVITSKPGLLLAFNSLIALATSEYSGGNFSLSCKGLHTCSRVAKISSLAGTLFMTYIHDPA